VELRNDSQQYASPGEGDIAVLDIGCQLDFSPGYHTTSGDEYSAGQSFAISSYEHACAGGKASLLLYAADGWELAGSWRARHQFRWNRDSSEMNVKQILEFVLARAGLPLTTRSQSGAITSFYPDFTIHPGNSGKEVIVRLLSFVPDLIVIEGNTAYLINPQSSDSSVYSYGTTHPILEGKYRQEGWQSNRIRVEGEGVLAETFDWSQLGKFYDRLELIDDQNIESAAEAQARGAAFLRKMEVESAGGRIRVPVNCGQQPFDVIDITDSRAGLDASKRRVLGFLLNFNTNNSEYEQTLLLGGV
jgi:hypothetical protein